MPLIAYESKYVDTWRSMVCVAALSCEMLIRCRPKVAEEDFASFRKLIGRNLCPSSANRLDAIVAVLHRVRRSKNPLVACNH